jgi:hypothetical protein
MRTVQLRGYYPGHAYLCRFPALGTFKNHFLPIVSHFTLRKMKPNFSLVRTGFQPAAQFWRSLLRLYA